MTDGVIQDLPRENTRFCGIVWDIQQLCLDGTGEDEPTFWRDVFQTYFQTRLVKRWMEEMQCNRNKCKNMSLQRELV